MQSAHFLTAGCRIQVERYNGQRINQRLLPLVFVRLT